MTLEDINKQLSEETAKLKNTLEEIDELIKKMKEQSEGEK